MYYRRTAALFLSAAGADRRDARAPTLVEWQDDIETSASNRLIGEVVQSRRRPLLGPSPG